MRPGYTAAGALVLGYAWGHAGGLVLAAVAVVPGYIGWIYVCPFMRCRRCKGSGKNVSPIRRYWGRCRSKRCTAGTRERLGAKPVHRIVRATITTARKDR